MSQRQQYINSNIKSRKTYCLYESKNLNIQVKVSKWLKLREPLRILDKMQKNTYSENQHHFNKFISTRYNHHQEIDKDDIIYTCNYM